jgi:hypothetical protein
MLGKVYYASGWFNPKADEEERRVCKKLKDLGFDVFSPREYFVLKPDASDEDRNRIFAENVKHITDCDVFFGITDYKDMGTIWECGCAAGLNCADGNGRKIVYYAETLPEGAPFNVMLSKSADVVITKFEDIDKLPELLETGKKYEGQVQ